MNHLSKAAFSVVILLFANLWAGAATPVVSAKKFLALNHLKITGVAAALEAPGLKSRTNFRPCLTDNRRTGERPAISNTVQYLSIYTGAGIVFYDHQEPFVGNLKSAPGAIFKTSEATLENIRKISLHKMTALALNAAPHQTLHQSPMAYQEFAGLKKAMSSKLCFASQRAR